MVMTIAPQVGGESQRKWRRYPSTIGPFALGAVSSGALVFGLAAAAGASIPGMAADGAVAIAASVVLAGAAAAYGTSYLLGRPLPVPHTYRQVPKVWREAFSPEVAAFLYGLGLGIGFFTKVPYATFYVAVGLSFVLANPLAGLAAGAVFGLARTLPPVLFRLRGAQLGEVEEADALVPARLHIQAVNGAMLAASGALMAMSVI
jgi:hypothetical protein